MADPIDRRRATLWWALTAIVALAFIFLASNDTVYNLTSPPGPLQILLRKSYSIGAFAIVGYLLARALSASMRTSSALTVAVAIGAYSLLIEVIQAVVGSHEGLVWNSVDVAFGFIGGYLGAAIQERLK